MLDRRLHDRHAGQAVDGLFGSVVLNESDFCHFDDPVQDVRFSERRIRGSRDEIQPVELSVDARNCPVELGDSLVQRQ